MSIIQRGNAILFTSGISDGWLSLGNSSGVISPSSYEEIPVSFDAAGLDFGVYNKNIIIASNDSVTPSLTIPVSLEVLDPTPNAPSYLTLSMIGNYIYLQWEEIPNIAGYKVYSSINNDSAIEDWILEATVQNNDWMENRSGDKKFYFVRAYRD